MVFFSSKHNALLYAMKNNLQEALNVLQNEMGSYCGKLDFEKLCEKRAFYLDTNKYKCLSIDHLPLVHILGSFPVCIVETMQQIIN
jgi:hypothetical protein